MSLTTVTQLILILSLSTLIGACTNESEQSNKSDSGDDNTNSEVISEITLEEGIQTGRLVSDDFFIVFSDAQPKVFNKEGGYTFTTIDIIIHANDINDLNQTQLNNSIKFKTSWGSFDSDQCNMGSDGSCTVTWYSGANYSTLTSPVPSCEVAFTAFTAGEEYFIDANDDGLFNVGESFRDLDEPYLDVDQNGVFTASSGKELIDLAEYSGGIKNASHDSADGKYNGSLCDDMATNTKCSTSTETIIWTKSFINVVESNDDTDCIIN